MKLSEINTLNKDIPDEGYATIICNNGLCSLDSNVDIAGIQIDFNGKVEITPTLPEGWIMQGNKSKILIFTLQNVTIQKNELFTYLGIINIKKILLSNPQGRKVICNLENVKSNFKNQHFDMSLETNTWDNMKDKRKKGIVKTTSYKLPDYGLPKVDKTKIKKTKRRTSTSSYTTGGGSSGGSGGY